MTLRPSIYARTLFGVLVTCGLCLPCLAHAQQGLAVELVQCTQVVPETFERHLRVEIARPVSVVSATPLAPESYDVRIFVRCLPEQVVELVVVPKDRTLPSTKRTVTVPKEQQHEWFLAFAVAELLEEQRFEAIEPEQAPAEPEAPPKAPAPPADSSSRASTAAWRLSASAFASSFQRLGPLIGGSLGIERVWPKGWVLAGRIDGGRGAAEFDPGRVDYTLAHAQLHAGIRTLLGAFEIGASAGFGVGLAWAQSAQRDGVAPWGGPGLHGWAHWHMTSRWSLMVGVDLGVPLLEVQFVEGASEPAGIRGPWGTGHFGMSWTF